MPALQQHAIQLGEHVRPFGAAHPEPTKLGIDSAPILALPQFRIQVTAMPLLSDDRFAADGVVRQQPIQLPDAIYSDVRPAMPARIEHNRSQTLCLQA